MSTKFLSPGWRMPRNANQSKSSNYSLDFNSSPYIDTNLNTGSYSSFSVSAWIKADTLSSGKVVAAQTRNGNWSLSSWLLYIEAPSSVPYMTFYMMSGGLPILAGKNTVLSINQWYHIVATWDGATSKMYIDGVKETREGPVSSMNTSVVNTLIGASHNSTGTGATGGWDGLINEVSIFDYALSQSQVTTLWGGGTSVSNPMALPSPPIAYYPLGGSAAAFRTPVNTSDQWLIENNAIGDYVFDFNGSSSYIDTTLDIAPNSDLSVSFWFNWSQDQKLIITDGDFLDWPTIGFGFQIMSNGSLRFVVGDNGSSTGKTIATSANSITADTWYHIVGVCDLNNEIRLYLNGTSVDSTSVGSSRNETSNNIRIGGDHSSSKRLLNGKLNGISIFNTALSSTEVETLYNYGSPIRTLANVPQSSNLKAWYKLDASEVYNSSTTEWSIDNNQNPSAYPSSLNFNSASSDNITVNSNTGLNFGTGDFTYSLWGKINTTTSNPAFYGGGSGSNNPAANSGYLSIGVHTSQPTGYVGATRCWISGEVFNGTTIITDDNWYNIVLTRTSGVVQIYVDGNIEVMRDSSGNVVSNPTSSNSITNTNGISIGSFRTNANYINGFMSNASIWNTALTPAQITEIYNNGTPSNLSSHSATSNLVSWWKLNNTTTGIQDSKGSNNGTNNGATEYTGFVNKLVGDSSGMSQANLVQSDLQTVAPYSKYALDFDSSSGDYIDCGDSDTFSFGNGSSDSPFTVSAWVYAEGSSTFPFFDKYPDAGTWSLREYRIEIFGTDKVVLIIYDGSETARHEIYSNSLITRDQWQHVVITYDGRGEADAGEGVKIYINGSASTTTINSYGNYDAMENTTSPVRIGRIGSTYANGIMSNASIWNAALTSAQVSELYNEGLPGNLNSHSAYSNLVSWWQLGENSSFDGNDWIVADEKGSNNGTSVSMPVGALVNGVGTTANGVSSGMSEGSLVGDAPYSTANALSSGMSVESRVSGVSDATITTGGTGYTTGTNIATTGGTGTNCTINITTVSGGAVTALTINSGGSNYAIGDVLTISGGNVNATITVSGLNTP